LAEYWYDPQQSNQNMQPAWEKIEKRRKKVKSKIELECLVVVK